MYQNVNWHNFQDAFQNMGRGDQFSYEGLRALFDYIEQLEEDMGEEIELDVIALCCEYSEIEEDEEAYKEYIGDDAERDDLIIATLPCSVLVREG
jgi:hypothetical protein